LHPYWIVEPWPEPADGDALLRDIIRRIRRHVVLSYDDALTIALWIMMSWVHDEVATHSPILNINSPEPECGKSTTLGLASLLMPRCISTVEVTEAALYRSIELWHPSFAIDEFDSVLSSEDKTALRSVINSGHTRAQGVLRAGEKPKFTPELFSTFCPKAIGMVGRKLPATTLGRCIIVELHRRKTGEPIDKFEHKDDAELEQLRRRLLRWSTDNKDALQGVKPAMPPAFDNRRADNWRLLLAIAELAGEEWADKARVAAAQLEGASDTTTIGVMLLADTKRIRDEVGDCILSAVLVERLKEDPERPWATWSKGKGLTQNTLAKLLGGFGIHSQNVRPSHDLQGRGYKWSQFEDAWARYLPEISSSSSETPK
jgi:putative DNA primase/helicase